MFKLVEPNITLEEKAKDYIEEFIKYNSSFNGTGGLEKYILKNRYQDWLNFLEELKKGPVLNYVQAATYFLMDEEEIIGMVNIRHDLNEFLLARGGNIGYSIRPTKRRKGYGKLLLYLALKKCQELDIYKVLITCDDENIASFKTIEALGGVLENKIEDEDELVRRYWIEVNSSIEKNKKIYEEVVK